MSDQHTISTPPSGEKIHLFDDPKNIKRAIYILVAICIVAFLFDFIIHRHVEHPWENLFGFYALYGFGAYTLLVLISRQLRKILMRKEDYYDD